MAKTIQYPTAEWLEAKVDKTGCSLEEAEMAWWDGQVDKGNPTPWDLPPEQEKEARKASRPKAHKVVDPSGKTKTRERKPNEDKRFLVDCLRDTLQEFDGCEVVNPERQVDFHLNGVHYSVTLTAHRPPKDKGKS
jgi:hypothetical protein